MNIRRSATALGLAIAIGTPLAALANDSWERSNDEAGWAWVAPKFGAASKSTAPTDVKRLQAGDISTDRQYVYLDGEGGWQLRPMQYRLENGRFAHVDDPVGHMHRVADNSPLTAQDRAALERSGGG
jgi:hypothetical protein